MMVPVGEVRRLRLKDLIQEHGSIAKLNEALGRVKTDATLSQYVNRSKDSRSGKPKYMGDTMAREIEETLKLPLGWMDSSEDVALSPAALQLGKELDSLPRSDRDWALTVWHSTIDLIRQRRRQSDQA
jgi:hypothetical protein